MRSIVASMVVAAGVLWMPVARAQVQSDSAAQKAAMQKLNFLAGSWSGTAVMSGAAKRTIRQTETVQYKLDGLAMVVEGSGRDSGGNVVFEALAVISFDPKTGSYRIRAWKDGNFVDTEFKAGKNQFEWGFERGAATMLNQMQIDEQGRWVEVSEVTLANGRKVQALEMTLSRKSE